MGLRVPCGADGSTCGVVLPWEESASPYTTSGDQPPLAASPKSCLSRKTRHSRGYGVWGVMEQKVGSCSRLWKASDSYFPCHPHCLKGGLAQFC